MTNTEVYDKFFVDEEYELQNAPTDTYSYRSGWNNALKRASIIVCNEIRPKGKWIEDSGNIACSKCHTIWLYRRTDYCPNCGAEMRKGGAE